MAKPEAASETVLTCSKCGVNPRADTSSTNPWCKECRAEYQRGYWPVRVEKSERRGFALGVSAMRELLALEFDRLGFGMFSAVEVRDLILRAPGPKLPD